MINRLPLEFRSPGNGRKSTARPPDAAASPGIASAVCRRSSQYIVDYPVAALGAAFVTGLLLARLVKR
jgi:hypothetical protein